MLLRSVSPKRAACVAFFVCFEVAVFIAMADVLRCRRRAASDDDTSTSTSSSGTRDSKNERFVPLDDGGDDDAGGTPPGGPFGATIAIGLAITSRGLGAVVKENVLKMPFFHSLLRSFCQTASSSYDYRFYLGYDGDDPYFRSPESIRAFHRRFRAAIVGCPKGSAYSLHWVRCPYSGKPSWAQNDAMMEAYLDGADYFYRVNDDTVMTTSRWTETFIRVLAGYDPPGLGVVGPTQRGGNGRILTYDFTHRTHVDVHGFYYPRVFTDWYADRWISDVYQPGRYAKLRHVRVLHTREWGKRYSIMTRHSRVIAQRVAQGAAVIKRYSV